MGFGQEMREFGVAFNNMAGTMNNISTRRAKYHQPGLGELGPAPFGDNPKKIEPIQTDTTQTDTTKKEPDATTTSSTPSTHTGGTGKSFIQTAYNYYRGKGLSHVASAGAAGNLMQESGGDRRVFEGVRKGDAGSSMYAGQWNNFGSKPGQGRLDKLHAFAKSRGRETPTLSDQLDFVLEEGNPKSPYADAQWAKAFPSFQNAKSVEEATALRASERRRAAVARLTRVAVATCSIVSSSR